MNKEEIRKRIEDIDNEVVVLDRDINYYDAMQQSLKLILNGSYGAFAAKYFVLFNNHVAGTITAEGRQLTKTMGKVNQDYWYNLWHNDKELHMKLFIKNVEKIHQRSPVTIYGDTDSLFVGFKPAIDSCVWKNNVFNEHFINNCPKTFYIIRKVIQVEDKEVYNHPFPFEITNPNFKGFIDSRESGVELDSNMVLSNMNSIDSDIILIDGIYIKDRNIDKHLIRLEYKGRLVYNWDRELDFIHGLDKFRVAQYFVDKLEEHATSYNVDNLEDFEMEKVNESIINLEKKKYIMHELWEDGIEYPRLKQIVPKGVELTRSSTPVFVRDKTDGIYRIVNYLFSEPDTYNIKDLVRLVKDIRKQFELVPVNDISVQSSCSNYDTKVKEDKKDLRFEKGTHFAVKAAAHHNYLLNKHPELKTKYNLIKSGDKVKIYYSKSETMKLFAFKRGSYPYEFAPEVDYELQFQKVILKTINSIIKKMGLPEINKRLSVLIDIFSAIKSDDNKTPKRPDWEEIPEEEIDILEDPENYIIGDDEEKELEDDYTEGILSDE